MEDFSLLKEALDMLKELSPLVWEAARRKLIAVAITEAVWSGVLLVLSYVCFRNLKPLMARVEKSEDVAILLFAFCLLAVPLAFFIGMVLLTDVIQILYAPDYHTIELLMKNIRPN
jgi:hypothetical protein